MVTELPHLLCVLHVVTVVRCAVIVLFAAVSADAQTTTWRAANNPHVVNGTVTIPACQTVVMEPGVRVQINANSKLQVNGTLTGAGTAANRIQINGADNYSARSMCAGQSM